MLVGVISDTHGRLDVRAYNALADCDAIIHAGDICDAAILCELETLAPVTAVLGNNDIPSDYPASVQRFAHPQFSGVKFLIAHYPSDVRISLAGSSALAPGDPIPDICVHGHTHRPRLEWGAAAYPARFALCPGSASRPRGGNPPSVAKVRIDAGKVQRIYVESLDGDVLLSVGE